MTKHSKEQPGLPFSHVEVHDTVCIKRRVTGVLANVEAGECPREETAADNSKSEKIDVFLTKTFGRTQLQAITNTHLQISGVAVCSTCRVG